MVPREFQFRHLFRRYELRRDDYDCDYDDDHGRDRDRGDARDHANGGDVHVLLALPYIARNRNCRNGIRDNYIHSRMYIRRRLFRSSIRRKSQNG
jgi:hypothetical protein